MPIQAGDSIVLLISSAFHMVIETAVQIGKVNGTSRQFPYSYSDPSTGLLWARQVYLCPSIDRMTIDP
jgi:hypothetical protein